MGQTRKGRSRALTVALAAMAALTIARCGGGGGGGNHASTPAFECSDSPVAPDIVASICGTKISKDVWRLMVVLGGPTTSADISGLTFDVVFDPADLSYVAGSAEQGTLLNQDGDDPLLVASLANNDPGRLVVGIHRTNQPAGVGGVAQQNPVMSFCLKANMLSDFGPVLVRFENAEAVDSSNSPIGSIHFNDQLTLGVN